MESPIIRFRVSSDLLKLIKQLEPYLQKHHGTSNFSECCRYLLIEGIKQELSKKKD